MSNIQKKLDALKAGTSETPEEKSEVTETTEIKETPVDEVSDLEALIPQFGAVVNHPMPEVIGEISEQEKSQLLAEMQAAQRAQLPPGLYAYGAGSLFGKNGLVKLTPTPHGNYQSPEDIEASGTEESWKQLLELGQAFEVE